jgi:hypothetical protein
VFVYAGLNARAIAPVWRKIMKQLGLGIVVAIGLTLPAFGQEAVFPEEGVYILNPVKSTFRGPAIKNQVLYVGKEANSVVGFDANGKPYSVSFPNTRGASDGQSHPANGLDFDAQANTRIDPYTTRAVRTKDGKMVSALVTIYNPDSKTMTVSTSGTGPAGAYSHVLVFEKQ